VACCQVINWWVVAASVSLFKHEFYYVDFVTKLLVKSVVSHTFSASLLGLNFIRVTQVDSLWTCHGFCHNRLYMLRWTESPNFFSHFMVCVCIFYGLLRICNFHCNFLTGVKVGIMLFGLYNAGFVGRCSVCLCVWTDRAVGAEEGETSAQCFVCCQPTV